MLSKSSYKSKSHVWGLSRKYPTIFLPTVSNDERVGKLSAVVEGTYMHLRDICCLVTPPDASVAAK
jgi:hypothetical protein